MTEEQKQALANDLTAYIGQPLNNPMTRSQWMEVARIALAALTAPPVKVDDSMALAFHKALNDGGVGHEDLEEIKVGLEAAFCNIPRPAPAADLAEMCDRQYIAGLQAGFRLGDAGDNEGLRKATTNYRKQIIDSRQSITCAATMRNIEDAK